MRRLVIALLLLLNFAGCKRVRTAADAPAEQPAELLSIVNMSDARGAVQLVGGFHGLEHNSWRWTMRKFEVVLKPPEGVARLELQFSIPESVINKLGPITVSAVYDGAALPPETYSRPGDATYVRDVPPRPGAKAVDIEFSTDKSLTPDTGYDRELALVAKSVGLAAR